jgi:aminopeptidase N
MADSQTPEPVRLQDYRPPDYLVETVELDLRLEPAATEVGARLAVRRNPAAGPGRPPLVLDGQELELLEIRLDGEPLGTNRYEVGEERLSVAQPPERFVLETRVRIHPERNTALEGLYVADGIFCTQCEAEGFRRITWFPDRPDVMARYRVRIEGDRAGLPVLLSNGNLVEQGELPGGRHFALWEDPFAKPSYLFALVAGRLARIEDRFVTRSGREVLLEIYTEPDEIGKCAHAMASLKKAMRWDEDRFALEYDLDRFMIVAIAAFNFGAMENKGLNIFNTKYVLARPETATDADYRGIESVVAHEYFHNWTGNRVTCRDWFQLSLKEGLTVFRDQEFTADLHSRPLKRIADVRRLRSTQFVEDAGPLAHPVRPESYLEINNFYTPTVYEKGAEVIRMLHTLIGEDAFQRGMRLYLQRHDGQAVTCEDFVAAMEAAAGRDLAQFRRWYSQAGTPRLEVAGVHDPAARRYTLTVRQSTPPTPGQPDKQPLHIPLAMGLLAPDGRPLPLRLAGEAQPVGTSRVLDVRAAEERFVFEGVEAPPVPSLLRGFSAPVRLEAGYGPEQLRLLMARDEDPFVRWEAGQTFATGLLLGLVEDARGGRPLALEPGLVDAFAALLEDPLADPAFFAEALTLPSEAYLGEQLAEIDVDAIRAARQFVRAELGRALAARWHEVFAAAQDEVPYSIEARAMGRRALKNTALAYLVAGGDHEGQGRAVAQFERADNMTDRLAALAIVAETELPARTRLMGELYERFAGDALVVDKWFALQATAQRPDAVETVRALLDHEAFQLTSPNRVRALIGAFAGGNPTGFHRKDGAGYALVADQLLALDRLNPTIAARIAGAFSRWRRHTPDRRALMQAQLERILATTPLSRDLYEITSKSLAPPGGQR